MRYFYFGFLLTVIRIRIWLADRRILRRIRRAATVWTPLVVRLSKLLEVLVSFVSCLAPTYVDILSFVRFRQSRPLSTRMVGVAPSLRSSVHRRVSRYPPFCRFSSSHSWKLLRLGGTASTPDTPDHQRTGCASSDAGRRSPGRRHDAFDTC